MIRAYQGFLALPVSSCIQLCPILASDIVPWVVLSFGVKCFSNLAATSIEQSADVIPETATEPLERYFCVTASFFRCCSHKRLNNSGGVPIM